ncbi:hypothetical protein GCM10023238_30100 [Streptomyces heliomycini]
MLGERRSPRIVLEHSGADTHPHLPVPVRQRRHGRPVRRHHRLHGDVDLRFLWMRQKRLQGSHVATAREAREVTG